MAGNDSSPKSDALHRESQAGEILAKAFQKAGWKVIRKPAPRQGFRPDLLVSRQAASYAVEIEMGVEGRSDRLIPLWSQAYLQAAHKAGKQAPLAVVAAPKIAPRAARRILDFAREYAPKAAAGVIDLAGLCLFRGPHLESLNAPGPSNAPAKPRAFREQAQLFSDLNQWMLKVLLAPELPQDLLAAPRGRYRNASELARAADVSVMSAFRFVQQLQREGHLHESAPYLQVVRRQDLFARWQAAALRSAPEAPMRFLLRAGDLQPRLKQMLKGDQACLGLFAAAEALGFGLVEGVPPHLYVRRLPAGLAGWKNIVPVEPGEAPDLIVRQAPARRSVFRGVVHPRGLASCDILQVWLDVAGHPARGREQADLIRQRALQPLLRGDRRG